MLKIPMVGPQIMAWLAWSPFLPGWPENSKFQGKLRANYGEILQLSGMHEDEGRAVVGYACQMGRWRGPDLSQQEGVYGHPVEHEI